MKAVYKILLLEKQLFSYKKLPFFSKTDFLDIKNKEVPDAYRTTVIETNCI